MPTLKALTLLLINLPHLLQAECLYVAVLLYALRQKSFVWLSANLRWVRDNLQLTESLECLFSLH